MKRKSQLEKMDVPKLIEVMSTFASNNTRGDHLSNRVAAVVSRLIHQESLFENPLTPDELKIIRTFQAYLAGNLGA